MSWHDQALCATTDPELWFPEKGESGRIAKQICGRCPVQAPCLTEAIATGERHGIRGGLNHHERRSLNGGRLAAQAGRAQDHQRIITALPPSEAAAELGVSARTVQRWRQALRGAA